MLVLGPIFCNLFAWKKIFHLLYVIFNGFKGNLYKKKQCVLGRIGDLKYLKYLNIFPGNVSL